MGPASTSTAALWFVMGAAFGVGGSVFVLSYFVVLFVAGMP